MIAETSLVELIYLLSGEGGYSVENWWNKNSLSLGCHYFINCIKVHSNANTFFFRSPLAAYLDIFRFALRASFWNRKYDPVNKVYAVFLNCCGFLKKKDSSLILLKNTYLYIGLTANDYKRFPNNQQYRYNIVFVSELKLAFELVINSLI